MNQFESNIIKLITRKNNQVYIPDIIDFIQNNNIYSRPSNLNDYNLDKPINRFSSAVEILHKHLKNTHLELDLSTSIKNNVIPLKNKVIPQKN
jgi:hypothetical protein